MDDPNDPLVRALREDPLPEPPYAPGRFAERLRRGELGRQPRRSTASAPGVGRRTPARALVVLVIVGALVGGILIYRAGTPTTPGSSPSPSPTPSPTAAGALGPTIRIGISLPLTADATSAPDALRDGALLAITDANARHLIPGITIEPVVLDHTSPGNDDLAKAVRDLEALVADPSVVGVVGPFNSSIAQGQIPVSNTAGLLLCSPSASAPDLTKGPLGQQLRVSHPDQVAFLRLGPTDDDVGPGMADFAVEALHAHRVFVIDDGADYGMTLADAFAARLQTDGGTVVDRQSTTPGTTDYAAVVKLVAASHPDLVMYGGVNAFGGSGASGAGALRRQMAAAGIGGIPLVGGDGLKDLDVSGESLLDLAGQAAAGTYSADLVPSTYPGKAALDAAFQAAYGRAPGPYAGPGYACAQVILQAVAAAARNGGISRALVRYAGADASTTFATVLGSVRFDAAGDETSPNISMDTVDPKANGGAGGWVVATGPVP